MIDTLTNYEDVLRSDLVEQFKMIKLPGNASNQEERKTDVLLRALGRQLQDVRNFFIQLSVLLNIEKCDGVLLDNVGDIVRLNRLQAVEMLRSLGTIVDDVDDATYRALLLYKNFMNTAEGTYDDVLKSLSMIWDGSVQYIEDPAFPATIVLGYELFNSEDHEGLLQVPVLKPGGVTVMYRAAAGLSDILKVGGGLADHVSASMNMDDSADLPEYLLDEDSNLICDETWAILCEEGDNEQ